MSILSLAAGQKPVWSTAFRVKLTLPDVISASVGVYDVLSAPGLLIAPAPLVCHCKSTLSPPAAPVSVIASGAHTIPSVPASAKGALCKSNWKVAVSIQLASKIDLINLRLYVPASFCNPWKLLPANVAGLPPPGPLTICHVPFTPGPSNVERSTVPGGEHSLSVLFCNSCGQLQSGAACVKVEAQPVAANSRSNCTSVSKAICCTLKLSVVPTCTNVPMLFNTTSASVVKYIVYINDTSSQTMS